MVNIYRAGINFFNKCIIIIQIIEYYVSECKYWDNKKLTDWLTNWHRFSDWLKKLTEKTDWTTDWLTDWLNDWMTDWAIDWLTDWLTDSLTDWLGFSPDFMRIDPLFWLIPKIIPIPDEYLKKKENIPRNGGMDKKK